MITGIVLAGGRSSRFGGDKLSAELDGRSVLAATLEAVAPIVDGIVVAGPSLPAGFVGRDVPIAVVPDVEAFEGPLAALANVLATAVSPQPSDLAVVVAGDMPRMAPAVLAALVEVLDVDPTIDAAFLGRPRPDATARRQVLPLALRVAAARAAAQAATAAGDRSLHALIDRLPHAELPADRWTGLDPGAGTLVDIDTSADLDRLR